MNNTNKQIKWAIYRGKKFGFFALMLVENLEDAEDLLAYPQLKKAPWRLPVVVGRMGGMHGFNPADESYVETRVLPEDAEPLTLEEQFPVNSDVFELGFVSPDGDTFACVKGSYMDCAEAICTRFFPGVSVCSPEQHLLLDGWISILQMDDELYVSYEVPMTKKQAAVIQKIGVDKFHPNIEIVLRRAQKGWLEA